MPGYIHHVEWCVSDLYGQVQVLVSHYGFEPVAQRLRKIQDDFVVEQIFVQSGATRFMLTQKTRTVQAKVRSVQDDEYPVLVCCPGQDHVRDTVFNVALKIGPNVDEITEKIQDLDANSVLVAPNDKCHSRLSVVKSCCGNVIHSLLEKDFDPYPPGFEAIQTNVGQVWNENWLRTTHMDHVTYVCHPGQSQKILQWYNSVFKMKRFLVNPQESIEDGVEISGDVNMRLSVGEWLSSWMCREEGVQFQNDSKLNFKLVLAEPLDNEKGSHVQNFLDGHGGPGLQHIGLTTPNACQTVSVMSKNGAQFRKPPPTYYQLVSQILAIFHVKLKRYKIRLII